MTGRELITYILTNNLSDKEIFEDGKLVGYISEEEAGERFGVGSTTIRVWVNQGKMNGLRINDTIYVPFNVTDPRLSEVSASKAIANSQRRQ